MATKDINLYESGSGGEMKLINSDLLLSETIFQTIYLALFGGNVEENSEWWGNELFYPNQQSKRLVSETERALNNTALNSSGRETIESSVKSDLQFLNDVIDFNVEVSITALDKVKIEIFISELENQPNRRLEMIWNNAKNELIIQNEI